MDELFPGHGVIYQLGHGVLAFFDLCRAHQGLFQPAAKQSAAHGGLGLVQHPQKASPLFPGAHGLGELQVPPGGEIQLEKPAGLGKFQRPHVGKLRLLIFL